MSSSVLVEFKLGDENAFYPFQLLHSFADIKSYVSERWPSLCHPLVKYNYSYGSRSSKLVSEADFAAITWLVEHSSTGDLQINVIDGSVSFSTSSCHSGSSSSTSSSIVSDTSVSVQSPVSVIRPGDDSLDSLHKPKILRSHNWDKLLKSVGEFYRDGVKEFRICLEKYACESGYFFDFGHNNASKVSVYCKKKVSKGCLWYVYASIEKGNDRLYVKSFTNTHTCGEPDKSKKTGVLSSNVVCDVILDEVRARPSITPNDIILHLKHHYGYNISYKIAGTALRKARDEFFGDSALSYNLIKAYFEKVKAADPSSHFFLQVDPVTRSFESVHFAFGACIAGFRACRPLLFIDATFLKSKFKGTLLTAIAKDANRGLFPVAFSITDSETANSWTSFLKFLAPLVSDRVLTFVSDRHHGIPIALKCAFPDAFHGFCMFHLKQNLKKKFRGSAGTFKVLSVLLDNCAKAVNEEEYERCLEVFLLTGTERASEFMANLPREQYADAFFLGKRYGEMTSNAAESFNSQIKKFRDLPITELIDSIRNLLMVQMHDRLIEAKSYDRFLAKDPDLRYWINYDRSRPWSVKPSSDHVFQVMSDPVMTVDIINYTCSCFHWQIDGFPCPHALAALHQFRPLDHYKFVDPYFSTLKYIETYSQSIPAISTYLDPAPPVDDLAIQPPSVKRLPGRPKKNRYSSDVVFTRSKRLCGRCNEYTYHNKSTCDALI